MLPIDDRQGRCIKQSSECIVWEGPDIPCIGVCNGDSLEKVVFDAVSLFCSILETLQTKNVDISCLGLQESCKPKNINELLQIIIDKICKLQELIAELEGDVNNIIVRYTDCRGSQVELSLNEAFQNLQNQICNINNQIATINTTISNIQSQISNINEQITYILNNCCNASVSFEMTVASLCSGNTTITSFGQLATYLSSLSSAICCLYSGIGIQYSSTCQPLSLSIECNGVVRNYSTILTFLEALADIVSGHCAQISNINDAITNITNTLTNVQIVSNVAYCNSIVNTIPIAVNYYWDNSNFRYEIQASVIGTVSGFSFTNISYAVDDVNTTPGTFSAFISSSSLSISFTNDLCTPINISPFRLYNPNPKMYIRIGYSYAPIGFPTNCSGYIYKELDCIHCRCGYVEGVEFIERNNITNINRR